MTHHDIRVNLLSNPNVNPTNGVAYKGKRVFILFWSAWVLFEGAFSLWVSLTIAVYFLDTLLIEKQQRQVHKHSLVYIKTKIFKYSKYRKISEKFCIN